MAGSFLFSTKIKGVHWFKLLDTFHAGKSSKILRFQIPEQMSFLDLPAPSGVKILRESHGTIQEKSYSPITLPNTIGYFDLLVKEYPPLPEEGFGYSLCNLQLGEAVPMKLKPPRTIHGSQHITNRWNRLGFVAGGTGVAPFIQIIRTLLADPSDTTKLRLLSINRCKDDILMKSELDSLARYSKGRFHVTYSLTQPDDTWEGDIGYGELKLVERCLPSHRDDNVMVMVCGKDGFVGTWAGETKRRNINGKKHKDQGPLEGLLKQCGFDKSQVYKF